MRDGDLGWSLAGTRSGENVEFHVMTCSKDDGGHGLLENKGVAGLLRRYRLLFLRVSLCCLLTIIGSV